MQARAAGLDSLPDDLLGTCLGLLPQEEGKSVTRVSKRFRRLFFEQPGPWRRLEVAFGFKPANYLASKQAMLRRVAPHVQEFALRVDRDWTWRRQPASFFPLLPATLLAPEVRLPRAVPAAAAQLLRRLSALRSLRLQGATLPSKPPAALQGLQQLQQLELSMGQCSHPDRWMAAIAQLGSLTQLHLGIRVDTRLRLPTSAAFLRRTPFEFRSMESSVELAGMHVRSYSLATVEFNGRPLACLKLDGVMHSESLAAFLDAAVPPSVELQALLLSEVHLDTAALLGCTQLATLQRLEMQFCDIGAAATAALLANSPWINTLCLAGDWVTTVGASLGQLLPVLQTLRLQCDLQSVPPELAQLANLRRLEWIDREGRLRARDVQVLACLPHLNSLGLHPQIMLNSARVVKVLGQHLPGVLVEQAA